MKQKKFFLGFIIFVIFGMFSEAYTKTVEVLSLDDFSTQNPPKSITIKLLEQLDIGNSECISEGSVLTGDISDIKSPKRLKRDARFSFIPKSYVDLDGETKIIHQQIKGRYTKPIVAKSVAKTAVLGVGGLFVTGLSTGVAAVKGAVKNEQDNILKSTAVSVYEALPVSYAKKGQELQIKKNDIFYLKFPVVNNVEKFDKEQNTKEIKE